jgi:hypothetical protein
MMIGFQEQRQLIILSLLVVAVEVVLHLLIHQVVEVEQEVIKLLIVLHLMQKD